MRLQQSESYLKFPDAPAGNDDIDPQPAIGAKAKRKQKAAPITATAPSTSIGRGATATTLRESFKQAARTHYLQLHLKFIEWGSDIQLPRKVLESVSVLRLF